MCLYEEKKETLGEREIRISPMRAYASHSHNPLAAGASKGDGARPASWESMITSQGKASVDRNRLAIKEAEYK